MQHLIAKFLINYRKGDNFCDHIAYPFKVCCKQAKMFAEHCIVKQQSSTL